MAILTREQILQATDLQTEEIAVPEWGGSVLVRGMTGTERDAFEASILEMGTNGKGAKMDMRNLRAKLAASCIVDEQGDRLFSDKDVLALGAKSATALTRVFEAAQRLSGLTAADMEELSKN